MHSVMECLFFIPPQKLIQTIFCCNSLIGIFKLTSRSFFRPPSGTGRVGQALNLKNNGFKSV